MSERITQNYKHSATGCFKATFISDLLLWYEYFILVVSSIAVAYFIFLSQTLCLSHIVRLSTTDTRQRYSEQTNKWISECTPLIVGVYHACASMCVCVSECVCVSLWCPARAWARSADWADSLAECPIGVTSAFRNSLMESLTAALLISNTCTHTCIHAHTETGSQ